MLGILLTFLVFNILLAGAEGRDPQANWRVGSLCFHVVLPIMYIADWFLFYERKKTKWYYPIVSIAFPLAYCIFIFIQAAIMKFDTSILIPGTSTPLIYPYFFVNLETQGVGGERVLDSYVMLECGGKKLAFVGITTPETITSSTPVYFQNENGNYIYSIDGGDDGSGLYAAVQAAIDDATAAGADCVIALGHLGVDTSSGPWTSRNVIANTTGLDALEWGSSELVADGSAESGSLLHVSGMKYTVDLSYASSVRSDDDGTWAGPPTGAYRVKNVQILNRQTGEYEPLDLTRAYNMAGYNYILRNHGDGFSMFDDAVCVVDYVSEDYMVLVNYIQSFPVDEATGLPTIRAEDGYGDVCGSGRITIHYK